ncbi:hypothetical protein ACQ4LE_003082 [Meloidogyne hapla]|uniref:Cysteine and histidine-rich domain-containing protein 1 n=2 Tax=Meloidogyne hapla TaxID=6305 RepID=A0A1I8BUT9_MELHA
MESPNLLLCYNKGCGNKFNPDENKEDSCLFHPGPPYFHDAYKIWKCCNKKSTDFSTWLSFKGCTRGPHNPDKPSNDVPKVSPPIEKQSEAEEKMIVWNGLNKPAERSEAENRERVLLSMQMTESAWKALEGELQRRKGTTEIIDEIQNIKLMIGTACTNNACKATYNGPETDLQECLHHPGNAIFHEGMKFWSCCERKTTDFGAFLDQQGCSRGKHCWTKQIEQTENLREDWFQRNGQVLISIYCKAAIMEGTKIDTDGLNLKATIKLNFGDKETFREYELFGEIIPSESTVLISERKVEIVLKQVNKDAWPRLTYK